MFRPIYKSIVGSRGHACFVPGLPDLPFERGLEGDPYLFKNVSTPSSYLRDSQKSAWIPRGRGSTRRIEINFRWWNCGVNSGSRKRISSFSGAQWCNFFLRDETLLQVGYIIWREITYSYEAIFITKFYRPIKEAR